MSRSSYSCSNSFADLVRMFERLPADTWTSKFSRNSPIFGSLMLPQYLSDTIRARKLVLKSPWLPIHGQRSSVVLLLRRRVENVPLELSILGLDFDILHNHDFILESHGIGRQRVGIYDIQPCRGW